jgi:integrase
VESAPVEAQLSWGAAIDLFVTGTQASNRPKTIRTTRQILRDFGELMGKKPLSEISRADCATAWARLREERDPKTASNWLGTLRGFVKFLLIEELIKKDFTLGIKTPSKSEFGIRETIFQEEWFPKIMEELEHWARPRFEDHWYTGLDNADIVEIVPRKHFVLGRGWTLVKTRSKEGTTIRLPIPPQISDRWLARHAECGTTDLLYPEANTVTPDHWAKTLRMELHRAMRRLGLPELGLKETRHTFTTRHVMRLVRGEKNAPSLLEIREWLGHARDSREIERVYAKTSARPEAMT